MTDDDPLDELYLSSLRDLKWILIAWLVNSLWVVGYCYTHGYDIDPKTMTTVLGMPSWVFWGVLLPWTCATTFTGWFAMFKMQDQPLPEADRLSEDHADG